MMQTLGPNFPRLVSYRHLLSLLCLSIWLCLGCSKDGLPTKVVYGTVSVGDQHVETGQIAFVPIDGTTGPTSVSPITGGRYRVEARGGVPLGTHRVEVVAKRKTGRQLLGGREGELADETVTMGPAIYGTDKSPLKFELTAGSDGEWSVNIPAH